MKQRIRINENRLKLIITESVKKILNEDKISSNDPKIRIRGYADKIVKIADALKANIVNTDGTTNVKANNLANSIINAANRIHDELDMLGGYKENLSTEIDMDDFNNL